jgi:integrase
MIDKLFSIRPNSPINLKNAVERHVRPACRLLGIPAGSWADLRHTYTTWGRRAGVKAESMRDQLGHSSVKTALDICSHKTV